MTAFRKIFLSAGFFGGWLGLFVLFAFFRPTSAFAAATLSLSPASGTYAPGSTFGVDIILDTGGDAVAGATAILTYDTTKLSVVDDDPVTPGVQIKAGTIFNTAPLTNTVDTTAGRIQYDSGSLGTTYNGHGTMATIHFQVLTGATGTALVSFVFNPGATSNTSIVAAASGPTNLLTTVNNGTYTIGQSTGGGGTPLPQTGAFEDTLLALAGGALFLALGIITWRKLIFISP